MYEKLLDIYFNAIFQKVLGVFALILLVVMGFFIWEQSTSYSLKLILEIFIGLMMIDRILLVSIWLHYLNSNGTDSKEEPLIVRVYLSKILRMPRRTLNLLFAIMSSVFIPVLGFTYIFTIVLETGAIALLIGSCVDLYLWMMIQFIDDDET